MNIEAGLEEHFKVVSSFNGVCLSPEETIKLETLLDALKSDIKCDEMLFWGKVMAAEKDYYIAEGVYFKSYPNFPKKKFYFSTSTNFNFSELPEIQPYHLKDFAKFNSYFIGNPDIIYERYENKETQVNQLDEEENTDTFKPLLKKKNLTESDRLSFVVRTIDFDTSVVPEGGFKMLPIGEMRRNDIFDGLSCDDLSKQEKYLHFRPVQSQKKKDLIAMGKGVFDFSFLDSITDDPIKNCWSIHVDSSKTAVNIRSLVWPGYYAYHKANTQQFAGVYIGYGIKTYDIPFMQQ